MLATALFTTLAAAAAWSDVRTRRAWHGFRAAQTAKVLKAKLP